MTVIYSGEIYKCLWCKKEYTYWDIFKTWKCPTCERPLNIRITVEGNPQSCQRLKPNELRIGDLVTLDTRHTHELLNVQKEGDNYILALKGYRRHPVHKDDFIIIIDAAWS